MILSLCFVCVYVSLCAPVCICVYMPMCVDTVAFVCVSLRASKRAMCSNFIVMSDDDDNDDDEPVFSGINVSSSSSSSSRAVSRSCSLTTRIVGYWHHLLYPAPTDERESERAREQAPQPNSSSPPPHLPLQTSRQVHSN